MAAKQCRITSDKLISSLIRPQITDQVSCYKENSCHKQKVESNNSRTKCVQLKVNGISIVAPSDEDVTNIKNISS